ncbi:MAG: peptidoglycan D,D-transpeptidase FtsI family protein [Planctomycetota bacterium]
MAATDVLEPVHDAVRARGRTRAICCLGAVLTLFGLLGGRLARMQALDPADGPLRAERSLESESRVPVHRGTILDRCGRELAVSRPQFGCAIDPGLVANVGETLDSLAGALALGPEERAQVLKTVADRRAADRPCRFVWVRRALSPAEAEAVAALDVPGAMLVRGWRRTYPQGRTACHAIGFVSRDQRGLEGLELVWDNALTGKPGVRRLDRDARRRALLLSDPTVRPAEQGGNLTLTLDAYIQLVVERELARIAEKHTPERATAVVLDPCTGAILALANWPAYDLNDARAVDPADRLNASVAAIYEPGSVFKPFILAAALEAGAVRLATPIGCEGGVWNLGYRVLHDTHGYGTLSAAKVVIKSSNIGIAKIGMRLGMRPLSVFLAGFGFGTETGLHLPGELPGLLRPVEAWNPRFSMTSIPMGQEVGVTPVQLASAFGALVNGGILVRPRLVESVRDAEGRVLRRVRPEPVRRVISATTSREVRAVLARVVTEGTGRRARCPEYDFGGKTGTAQIAGPGGYQEGQYVATFCGFGPVEAPRLVVLVSVTRPKNGYYGGTVSAPAVREILRESLLYLHVPPKTDAHHTAWADSARRERP